RSFPGRRNNGEILPPSPSWNAFRRYTVSETQGSEPMQKRYDRTREDVSNIVHLEHVNVTQPDQRLATLFYVAGLGGTRDPYIMVGPNNMWVNLGRSQMHLPSRDPQRLRGTIGL